MKKLLKGMVIAGAVVVTGCATKSRNVEVDGMYIADSGVVAIGSVEVTAAPVGEESAFFRYWEDTAWLSPSTKTRNLRINMTGSNTCARAEALLKEVKEILNHDSQESEKVAEEEK